MISDQSLPKKDQDPKTSIEPNSIEGVLGIGTGYWFKRIVSSCYNSDGDEI